MNLGNSIREIRKRRMMTQKDLANKVNIRNTYLSEIENGNREPSKKLLSKICEALDVDEAVLKFLAVDESNIDPKKLETYRILAPKIKDMIFDSYL